MDTLTIELNKLHDEKRIVDYFLQIKNVKTNNILYTKIHLNSEKKR